MIIPENKKERNELKEMLWQKQLNEEHILMRAKGSLENVQHTIQTIADSKELPFDEEEKTQINNKMLNYLKEEERFWFELRENHRQKWKGISQEHDKIVEYDNQLLEKKMHKEKEIDSSDIVFAEVSTMLMNSQYNWMQLKRTLYNNKWQIIDKRNGQVRFEAEPQTMVATIKEITKKVKINEKR